MLPRTNRFSFKGAVPNKVIQTPYLTIRYEKKGDNLKGAIVISKKVCKKATGRNRMKRILSETLANYKNSPVSIVLYVKKNAFQAESGEMRTSLSQILDSLLQ